MDNGLYLRLIDSAIEARKNSYSPYSRFKVGASILVDDSRIFSGCNIENASYGASNCAERTAIFNAVSTGYKAIHAICVVGAFDEYTYPCGICRQVMLEFAHNEDIPVIIAKDRENFIVHKLSEIIPFNFGKKDLSL